MSKRIDFTTAQLNGLELGVASNPGIYMMFKGGSCALFTDPDELRRCSTLLAQAANALEKSQRLTFADLKPGEWFHFVGEEHRNLTCLKLPHEKYSGYRPDGACHCCSDALETKPVVRVKATFEPVTE